MARRLLVPAFLVRSARRLAPGARVRVRANGRNEAGIVLQSKGRDGYVVLRRRNANEFAGVVSQGLDSTWAGSKYKRTMRRLLFPLGGRATKIAIAAIGAFAVFSGQVETIPVTAVLLVGAELLDQATGGDAKKNPRKLTIKGREAPKRKRTTVTTIKTVKTVRVKNRRRSRGRR